MRTPGHSGPRLILALVALGLLATLAYEPARHALERAVMTGRAPISTPARKVPPGGGTLPSLASAPAWVNGGPITPDSLGRRMTVMVVFSDTRPVTFDLL